MKKGTFNSWRSKARWYFDSTFSEKSTSQIIWLLSIIGLVFLTILALSFLFSEHLFEESTPSMSRPIRIISLLINPGAVSEVNPTMRVFAILVAIIGIIVLSGFLITVLSNMLERHVEHYRNGDIHYKLRGHSIVLGFNRYTISLIKKIQSENYNKTKILLVTSKSSSYLRERIEAEFSPHDRKDIIYYSEDLRSKKSLELIDSDKASCIYILGDSNNNNDSVIISCFKYLLAINKERNAPVIPCYLFLDSSATNFIIKQQGLPKEWEETLRIIPINIAESWAKRLFVIRNGENKFPAIPLFNPHGHNRLIIIGMTNWGIALAEVFARISHFMTGEIETGEYLYYPDGKYIGLTTITFVDSNIKTKMEKFCGTFPSLFNIQNCSFFDSVNGLLNETKLGHGSNFLDVRFEFVNSSIYNSGVNDLITKYSDDNPFIVLCMDDDNENIEAAIHLPDIVYKKELPLFVKQEYSNIVDTIINLSQYEQKRNRTEFQKYKNVIPFGMIDDFDILFNNEDNIVDSFQQMNEKVYGYKNSSLPINRYIEDLYHAYFIQLLWEQLNDKYSIEEIKEFINRNMNILMEVEHIRWNVNKLMSGYSASEDSFFGNNYITPYETLDEEFKQFDACNIQYIEMLIKEKGNGQH